MEIVILVIVAVAALCCMGTNLVMVFLLYGKRDKMPAETEKTREELERERMELEAQRKRLEGIQNTMSYTGFKWRENKE